MTGSKKGNTVILLYKMIEYVIQWRIATAFIVLVIISTPGYTEIQYEPEKEIAEAKKYFTMVEKQRDLQPFFPHRQYYNAKVYFDTAKYQLDEERNNTLASFYAVLALVELKTMHMIAMTRQMESKKLLYERDQYKSIADSGTVRNRRKAAITGSILKRHNGRYTCVIPEYIIFKKNSDELTTAGIDIFNTIGMVIYLNPASRISIKGVTGNSSKIPDILGKTKTIANFLHKEKRIGTNRMISSTEANEKDFSIGTEKNNFDRIEIIVTGIR